MRKQAVDKGTKQWGHSAGKWHLRASTPSSFCTWSQSPLSRQANRDGELGARNRLTSDNRPHVCFLGVRGSFFQWAVQDWRCRALDALQAVVSVARFYKQCVQGRLWGGGLAEGQWPEPAVMLLCWALPSISQFIYGVFLPRCWGLEGSDTHPG